MEADDWRINEISNTDSGLSGTISNPLPISRPIFVREQYTVVNWFNGT